MTFRQPVRAGDGEQELLVAAWVPASALTAPSWSTAVEVPRVVLPEDERAWPAPPGWPSWYAGPWANGPLHLPPGVETLTGPAWLRRAR